MAFGATPTDGSATPIPMSSAVPDGTNTPLALEGGPSITTGGNTLVPVSMYVKDGNDIAQGTSTDAANANSVIGQLKQIKTNTTLGQATMAASLPVTLANNQTAVPTIQPCIVSTVNSSVATLTANSVFTGTSESSLNFSSLSVEVFANVASAASGLSVQQSQDGTNWDVADTFSVLASTAFNTTVNLIAQFFRVVYTNGATGQATFRLQIIKQPVDVVLPRTLTTLGNLKTSLQEVNGTALSLGQAVMAASLPVTLASNQPTQNVTVSTALPAGAATIGAVTQASGPWTANITQVGSTNIVTGGVAGLLAVGGPVASGVANADNPVKIGAVFNTTQPTVTTGQVVDAQATARGAQIVATGVDVFTVQPGNTANTTPWLVTQQAATVGGSTPYHLISAASTNATNVKNAAGQLYGFEISNTNAAARYVRFYNSAAAPTVGTTTIVKTIQVPGNATVIRAYPVGLKFTSGIGFSATALMIDSDTTVIGAGDLSIDLDYF